MTGCDECAKGPCCIALMPDEACDHECGCAGLPDDPAQYMGTTA